VGSTRLGVSKQPSITQFTAFLIEQMHTLEEMVPSPASYMELQNGSI